LEARHFQAAEFARFHPGGSLGKRLLTKARDVMHTEPLPVIAPQTPLGEAVIHMSRGRLGLCVAMEANRVRGLITDGDVRRAMENAQDRFFHLTVEKPKCVTPDTQITEIDRLFRTYKIHSVLVTDAEGALLGIVDSFSTMF
jgi:arabinose-5-phosphate isomerase